MASCFDESETKIKRYPRSRTYPSKDSLFFNMVINIFFSSQIERKSSKRVRRSDKSERWKRREKSVPTMKKFQSEQDTFERYIIPMNGTGLKKALKMLSYIKDGLIKR